MKMPEMPGTRGTSGIPPSKLVRMALTLIGKRPDKEVAANLNRLKELLETGKFPQCPHE